MKVALLPNPIELFPGTLLVVAPHMDDELLACGGVMAMLPDKTNIHIIYATDGMKSPAPILSHDAISADLGDVRMKESIKAMHMLGVPRTNLHFLSLPEAALKNHVAALRHALLKQIERLKPDHILLPFRFDRHPDHLAVNRVLMTACNEGKIQAELFEYFVYYRWRLLPGRDVRQYIRPPCLLAVDTQSVAALKRRALDCFTSQTTIYYPWQTRPILTSQLLDDTSKSPEYFLPYDPALKDTAIFSKAVHWIRLVHRIEPVLQKWKYLSVSFLKRKLKLHND